MPGVMIILLMIYTGTRSKEIFIMESADVNIEELYMIGGVKTKSGKRRIMGHKLDTLADRVYIHKTAAELVESVNKIAFIE